MHTLALARRSRASLSLSCLSVTSLSVPPNRVTLNLQSKVVTNSLGRLSQVSFFFRFPFSFLFLHGLFLMW